MDTIPCPWSTLGKVLSSGAAGGPFNQEFADTVAADSIVPSVCKVSRPAKRWAGGKDPSIIAPELVGNHRKYGSPRVTKHGSEELSLAADIEPRI